MKKDYSNDPELTADEKQWLKNHSWDTKDDMMSLRETNKMATCIESVRQRVINSGQDSSGFPNWCPSKATFTLEAMKEYHKRYGK